MRALIRWFMPDSAIAVEIRRPSRRALDVALKWAAEVGGEIYRQNDPGQEPELYKPTG